MPRPAAGVLITCQGRILLVRRGAPPGLGRWDVPGGFMNDGESPEACARREIREELGLELGALRLAQVDVNPVPGGDVVDLLFETDLDAAQPRAGSDAAACAWFAPDALPEDLAFDTTQRILARWRRSGAAHAHRLVDGRTIRSASLDRVAGFVAGGPDLPAGWSPECGRWSVHDGELCGIAPGQTPAVLWLDAGIDGDHVLRFFARTIPPAHNDINCYWEGSGRIAGGPDVACTIAGVGGWWRGLTGIERHPDGGDRATTRLFDLEPGAVHEIVAGRLGRTDFLFVDGRLALQLDAPGAPRRAVSRVALATWDSHLHVLSADVFRVPATAATAP